MCLANPKAELLRELAAASPNRPEIDAIQAFVVVAGDHLGLTEEVLWSWRCGIIWQLGGQPPELRTEAESIQEPDLFREVSACAGAWRQGKAPDMAVAGRLEILAAWEYAQSVVIPLELD